VGYDGRRSDEFTDGVAGHDVTGVTLAGNGFRPARVIRVFDAAIDVPAAHPILGVQESTAVAAFPR